MKSLAISLALIAAVGMGGLRAEDDTKALVQIALLLDTSNSMDGLIAQAKSQLWAIVNEFAKTKIGGRTPDLRVALYEYGNDNIPASEGHIRMVLPLTDDLDGVSAALFKLATRGGQEYCGQVIQVAARSLQWSASKDDLKAIFIAGNEEFTQGTVSYVDACRAAIAKGIVVNTIFCGDRGEGVQGKWEDGARLADGKYFNIDQNRIVAAVAAPQDAEITRLNTALNTTYIPYGAQGREKADRQVEQDRNAASVSAANAAQRAASKSSAQYRNAAWDLGDAVQQAQVKIEDVKDADLPEAMRKMTQAERKDYVSVQIQKRQEIQSQIASLNTARDRYVSEQQAKSAPAGGKALGDAVIEAVQEWVKRK